MADEKRLDAERRLRTARGEGPKDERNFIEPGPRIGNVKTEPGNRVTFSGDRYGGSNTTVSDGYFEDFTTLEQAARGVAAAKSLALRYDPIDARNNPQGEAAHAYTLLDRAEKAQKALQQRLAAEKEAAAKAKFANEPKLNTTALLDKYLK